jgi:hypothetical protein
MTKSQDEMMLTLTDGRRLRMELTLQSETELIVKPVSLYDPPEVFEHPQYLPGLTTETLRVFVTTPGGVETDAVRDALDSYVTERWNAVRTEDEHVLGQAYTARYIVRRR